MENYIGKTCPYCKTEIKEGEEIKVCPACGIPHHVGCWEENKGCTTFGCSEQHYEVQGTNPTEVCSKCGAPLGDGQAFCPKCGTPKISRQNNCGKCGSPLAEGQEFCGKCGQKVGIVLDQNVSNAINQFNQNVAVKKKPKKTWLVILSIVLVVGILGSIGYVGVLNAQKEELQERLMSTKWWSYDDDTKLYLDFSEDEIEYSGNFGYYLGTQEISTMDYEIVDGNTIKVHGREIEVELDDDSVVFRPSFVNTDSYSLWMD